MGLGLLVVWGRLRAENICGCDSKGLGSEERELRGLVLTEVERVYFWQHFGKMSLSGRSKDIERMLAAKVHIGTTNADSQVRKNDCIVSE